MSDGELAIRHQFPISDREAERGVEAVVVVVGGTAAAVGLAAIVVLDSISNVPIKRVIVRVRIIEQIGAAWLAAVRVVVVSATRLSGVLKAHDVKDHLCVFEVVAVRVPFAILFVVKLEFTDAIFVESAPMVQAAIEGTRPVVAASTLSHQVLLDAEEGVGGTCIERGHGYLVGGGNGSYQIRIRVIHDVFKYFLLLSGLGSGAWLLLDFWEVHVAYLVKRIAEQLILLLLGEKCGARLIMAVNSLFGYHIGERRVEAPEAKKRALLVVGLSDDLVHSYLAH